MCYFMKTCNFTREQNLHRVLEFSQSQWLKPYFNSTHKKEKKQKKRMTRMEKRRTN